MPEKNEHRIPVGRVILLNRDFQTEMDVMRANLIEGDLGQSFARFAATRVKLAEMMVEDALQKYLINPDRWANIGQFALNYLTCALKYGEVISPDASAIQTKLALSRDTHAMGLFRRKMAEDAEDLIWEAWGEMVRELQFGL